MPFLQYTIMLEQRMHLNHYKQTQSHSQSPGGPTNDLTAETLLIKESLVETIADLQASVALKQKELDDIKEKIRYFYEYRRKRRELQQEERKFEGQLEDLKLFDEKLKKELKIMVQEEQVKKGRLIVEHNKIIEVRAEQKREFERKEQLRKHLEDVRKGTDSLRNRVKTRKEELKKKTPHKHAAPVKCLPQQLQQLQLELEEKMAALKRIRNKKKRMNDRGYYDRMKEQLTELQSQCSRLALVAEQEKKLRCENEALKKSIEQQKSIGTQSIDSKKNFLEQLSQKIQILETQRLSQTEELKSLELELAQLERQHQQQINLSKKCRRKRETKSRTQRNSKEQLTEPAQETATEIEQRPTYRWKGRELKRLCFLVFTLLLVLGLLLGSVNTLLLDITA